MNSLNTWRVLLCVALVSQLSFGSVIPMLPVWGEHLGASTRTIGYLFACYSLVQLFSVPALGTLSDRWGHRPVLLICLAGTVVSFIITALAQNLAALFVARILDGLSGATGALTRAVAVSLWDGPERTRALGKLAVTLGIGYILGPALGASLAPWGIMVPAWAGAVLAAFAFILALFFLPETVTTVEESDEPKGPDGSVSGLYLVNGLFWIPLMGVLVTMPVLADRVLKLSVPQTGLLLSTCVGLTAVGQIWGARRGVASWGHRKTVTVGILVMTLGVGFIASPKTLILGLILTCLAVGPVVPALLSWISEWGGTRRQGSVQGLGFTAEAAGRAAGAALAYELLQGFGQTTTYLTLAGILGLTFVIAVSRRATLED